MQFCPDGIDRYGRTPAVGLIDGRHLAKVLISEGLARETAAAGGPCARASPQPLQTVPGIPGRGALDRSRSG